MNLNHIAKKPFFDLFYRTPCMPLLLRAAFHDAGTFSTSDHTGYKSAYSLFNNSLIEGQEEL